MKYKYIFSLIFLCLPMIISAQIVQKIDTIQFDDIEYIKITKLRDNKRLKNILATHREKTDSIVKILTQNDSISYLYNFNFFCWDTEYLPHSIQIFQNKLLIRDIRCYGVGNLLIKKMHDEIVENVIDYNLLIYIFKDIPYYKEYIYNEEGNLNPNSA